MQLVKNESGIPFESTSVQSIFLQREVTIDFYFPSVKTDPAEMNLLLINDGQNMAELGLASILSNLYNDNLIEPLLCIGLHTGEERRKEYGVAGKPDYLGRGNKAGLYTSFIMEEVLPLLRKIFDVQTFKEMAFAGFSLGGLSALDIVWNHPGKFSKAGVFSGSFWWRSIDQTKEEYDDAMHRIMHQQIKKGEYSPGLKFFFQCGNMDETKDRNQNGIIDSIDDTLDIIKELENKGYESGKDIYYMEMKDGRHDIITWARAMPEFLKWGWSVRTP